MNEHLFSYKWYLKDGYPSNGIIKNNLNVFGTFICGGGSTMGYKLAGYNHLGGVEIDKEVAKVYKLNHNPKYLFNEDIREFNKRQDLPSELYSLDLLDGSPPCSTFSMAGSREKAWGKEKQCREGQAMQTLDDLVFVYCDTIIKLQPKVFILENVKGIIQGNAKVYSKNIVAKMQKAGYEVQVFCLNAASMGVPQKRERVFFIGYRKELNFGRLGLSFNEKPILYGEFKSQIHDKIVKSKYEIKCVNNCTKTGIPQTEKKSINNNIGAVGFGYALIDNQVPNTVTTGYVINKNKLCYATDAELIQIGSYPIDYDFQGIEPKYIIGMSVPPVMTAQIANQIKIQWLDKIKNNGI